MTVTADPAPTVSVVVLAWRLTDELAACLAGLGAQVDAPSFETVVVDNGATDEVRMLLAGRDDVVVVTLDHNAGFGGGCDAGVAAARGRSVVFLNDDASPRPGWLAALAARAAQDDHPVAVGSLLIDPDGAVQEAGSRLLADGGTAQHGRGLTLEAATSAGLLETRAVDYCSAAALWVDVDAFRRVGGFDEAFFPAYYEDADLQLRLRLGGRRVVVEPAAVVDHLSGGSTRSFPHYREFLGLRNGDLFRRRWADTLASAAARDAPADQVGDVRAPDLAVGPDDHAVASLPALADRYVEWLTARLDAVEAREEHLAHDFAALQHHHHEALQRLHATTQHVVHLEEAAARPLTVRQRLSGRGGDHGG